MAEGEQDQNGRTDGDDHEVARARMLQAAATGHPLGDGKTLRMPSAVSIVDMTMRAKILHTARKLYIDGGAGSIEKAFNDAIAFEERGVEFLTGLWKP